MNQPPPYKPPVPPLGIVKWSNSRNGKFLPAIVTERMGNCVRVMVFPTESRTAMVRDSVRHVTDPLFDRMAEQGNGVWDFTDEHKLLAGIAQLLLVRDDEPDTHPTPELMKLRPLLAELVYTPATLRVDPAGLHGSAPGDDNEGY